MGINIVGTVSGLAGVSSALPRQLRVRAFEHLGVAAEDADRSRCACDEPPGTAPDPAAHPRFALSTASPGSREQRLLHLGVLGGEADQIAAGGSGAGEGSPSGQGRVSPVMYIVKLST